MQLGSHHMKRKTDNFHDRITSLSQGSLRVKPNLQSTDTGSFQGSVCFGDLKLSQNYHHLPHSHRTTIIYQIITELQSFITQSQNYIHLSHGRVKEDTR